LVADAFAAGQIGTAQVRKLLGVQNHRTAELFRRDESMLVHQARTLIFSEFSRVVEYWFNHADPDGADQSDIDRRDRRRVSFDEMLSGMWSGHTLLDPISGVIVATELERLEHQLFRADWAEAAERLGREPKLSELSRTSDQRRADALVEMARRSAAMPPGSREPKPLFTVVFGAESFARYCQLASGVVLPPGALLSWMGEAELERILFGGQGRGIDVSFKRAFTGALRRLIEVRDQFCFHDFCEEPPSRCQGDHVKPHSEGGITAQWNGRLACGMHNRLEYRRRHPPRE
jgi:hypothetical protein